MPKHENLIARIRAFLTEAFDDDELTTLCADYFRNVYYGFAAGMNKHQKIKLLIDHCESKLYSLLAAIKQVRPEQYVNQQFPLVPAGEPLRPARNLEQIFISHDRRDSDFAHQLAADLKKRGWRVWIAPDNILPGERWEEAINRGLDESGIFVLVLSPAAVDSGWVGGEILNAIELERRACMRLILLEVEPCNVPPPWSTYQRIPFLDRYRPGLSKLIAELRQIRSTLTGEPVTVRRPPAVRVRKMKAGRHAPPQHWEAALEHYRQTSDVFIDLPKNLQPIAFLPDVEDGLTGQPLEIAHFYKKKVKDCDNWDRATRVAQEIERVSQQHNKPSNATAFLCVSLWLADWYWRNGCPEDVANRCNRIMECVLDESVPADRITKAIACYMLGLANHVQGSTLAALDSYLTAIRLFKITKNYWRLIGCHQQAQLCTEVLDWLDRLTKYIVNVRLNTPTETTLATLVYPWQSSIHEAKFAIAELLLIKPVTAREVSKPKSHFLSKHGQAWCSLGGTWIDGYQVRTKLRMFGLDTDDVIKPYYLRITNSDARSGTDLILPTGAKYYVLPVNDELELPGKHMRQGDYFIVWSSGCPNPDLPGVLQHKGDGDVVVGTFERDLAGNVNLREVLRPLRFAGERRSTFDFLGDIDFVLRSA